MSMLDEAKEILQNALQLGDRAANFTESTPLLGSIPEFDSMAVVTVLTLIEEQYGVTIDDADISAENFETVGSFARFLAETTAA